MFTVYAFHEGEMNPYIVDTYTNATTACMVLYDRNRSENIEYGYVFDKVQNKKIMEVGAIFDY